MKKKKINKPTKMSLQDQIKDDIDKAAKQFGEYQIKDKGMHEVMDIKEWVDELKRLSPPEAVFILRDVLKHEFGHEFVSAFLISIDDGTDEWTDTIFEDEILQDHY